MLVGQHCKLFQDATHGLPEGMSLNAPYKFHWIKVVRVEGDNLHCTGADEPMRLKINLDRSGREFVNLSIVDPLFGVQTFRTYPFRGEECGG